MPEYQLVICFKEVLAGTLKGVVNDRQVSDINLSTGERIDYMSRLYRSTYRLHESSSCISYIWSA